MPPNFQKRLGLWRSLLIYHGIPFRKRRLVQFYRPFIQPGDLCFDIGAHVGNRIAAWTDLGARVVALEPQPHIMQFLQKRFGKRQDITLRQEAAGASPGETTMFLSSRYPTVTSLSRSWINKVKQEGSFAGVKWDQELQVRITTLDQLIQEYGHPRLCKIDVEGYELQVLEGLSYPIPVLSFEYIPAAISQAKACVLRLSELGNYRYNWSVGEQYQMNTETWLNADQILDLLSGALQKGRSGDIYAQLLST